MKRTLFISLIILVSVVVLEAILWVLPLPDPYPQKSKRFHRFLPSWNHWAWNPRVINYEPPFEGVFNAGPLKGIEPQLVRYKVNKYGFLYPIERNSRSSESEIRIAVVGGSTVECIALQPERRLSAILEKLLRMEFEDREVTVLNLGLSGEAIPTHLATVMQHAVKMDLDVIIFMLGANELYRASRDWEMMSNNRSFSDVVYAQSRFLLFATRTQIGRRLHALMMRFKPQYYRPHSNEMKNQVLHSRPYFADVIERRIKLPLLPFELEFTEAALNDYETDVISLAKLAEAHGVKTLFITQPTLWKENLTQEEESVNWLGIYEHRGQAYRLSSGMSLRLLETLNRKLLDTCEKEGFECLDIASMVPKSLEIFYDPLHFNEKGAKTVAEIMRDALLSRNFIQ